MIKLTGFSILPSEKLVDALMIPVGSKFDSFFNCSIISGVKSPYILAISLFTPLKIIGTLLLNPTILKG